MTIEKYLTNDSLTHKTKVFDGIELSNELDIFWYDSNAIISSNLQNLAVQRLHPIELTIFNKRNKAIAKKQFIASRYVIKSLISKHFSIDYKQLYVYFDEVDVCLKVMHINKSLPVSVFLSHSAGIIVVAISLRTMNLGIDIEQIKPRNHQALAGNFYPEDETRVVKKHGLVTFYRIWTLKEALAKFNKQPIVSTLKLDITSLLLPVHAVSGRYLHFDVSLISEQKISEATLQVLEISQLTKEF